MLSDLVDQRAVADLDQDPVLSREAIPDQAQEGQLLQEEVRPLHQEQGAQQHNL